MRGWAVRTVAVTSRPGSKGRARPAATNAKREARRLLRFDGVERAAHWATALLFGILMATALPLYFVQVESLIGRRALVADIHTWSGRGSPRAPDHLAGRPLGDSGCDGTFGASTCGRRPRSAGCGRWDGNEYAKPDKFNPGQKLNALFIAGAIVVMLATGFVLKWFRILPAELADRRHLRP